MQDSTTFAFKFNSESARAECRFSFWLLEYDLLKLDLRSRKKAV